MRVYQPLTFTCRYLFILYILGSTRRCSYELRTCRGLTGKGNYYGYAHVYYARPVRSWCSLWT
ncbi:MAG: hypothetical protein QNL35_00410, partial [Emcibacteraceae bacterium]